VAETGGVSKAWALPLPDEEAPPDDEAPPAEEDTGVPSSEQAPPVGQPCAEGGTGPGHHYGAGWIWGDAEGAIPADAPLHLLMLAASRVMTAYYVASLAQAGVQVSPAGLGVLRILLAGDGLKSSDVAARGWSSPGTLTSVVNTLVREGYVERRSDAGDRRVVRLYLTDQGRRTCEDYYALAGPAWRDAFDFVSGADEPVVRKFFTDMIDQFSELTRKERTR
jgi:DNA-binding MarR family transcriptional regulator